MYDAVQYDMTDSHKKAEMSERESSPCCVKMPHGGTQKWRFLIQYRTSVVVAREVWFLVAFSS
jgi:hypothetical protein